MSFLYFDGTGLPNPQSIGAMRHSTALLQEEIIMATHATRHSFGRPNLRSVTKAAFPLLGIGALGYIVIAVAMHAPPLLSAAPTYAPESRIINAAPETAADVDYFPNRYVNQATKIDDPIATF